MNINILSILRYNKYLPFADDCIGLLLADLSSDKDFSICFES